MSEQKRKVLLVGGNGMLARNVAISAPAEYEVVTVVLPEFDITDQAGVLSAVEKLQPEVIINCAAYTNVDRCETEQALAQRVNGAAVGYLAEAAHRVDAVLVHISTDYVFDGTKRTPYVEEDPTNPQSVYGLSKLQGERALLSSDLKKYFIIRTSWLYGPGGKNFVETIIRLAKERAELGIVVDQVGTPTYTDDLAAAIYNLLALDANPEPVGHNLGEGGPPTLNPYGIYHFSNEGQCSWYGFAEEIIALARMTGEELKVEKIRPLRTEEYPLPAKRPAYSVFDKRKYKRNTGKVIPEWQASLREYFTLRNP